MLVRSFEADFLDNKARSNAERYFLRKNLTEFFLKLSPSLCVSVRPPPLFLEKNDHENRPWMQYACRTDVGRGTLQESSYLSRKLLLTISARGQNRGPQQYFGDRGPQIGTIPK